jgi:hypothetical protein
LFTFLMEVEKFNKENGKLTFCWWLLGVF